MVWMIWFFEELDLHIPVEVVQKKFYRSNLRRRVCSYKTQVRVDVRSLRRWNRVTSASRYQSGSLATWMFLFYVFLLRCQSRQVASRSPCRDL